MALSGVRGGALSRHPRPEFHQLELFLLTAEAVSFSAAARLAGISQPAVSKAIGRLEEICGGDLFSRCAGQPLTLTPVGRAILPSAKILLRTVDHQMARAAAAAQGRLGELAIGIEPILAHLLVPAVQRFMRECPEVRLNLVEDRLECLYRIMEARSLDMMIAVAHPQPAEPGWARALLFQEQLYCLLPEGHPLARRDDLHWEEFADIPLIFTCRELQLKIGRLLSGRGLEPLRSVHHNISSGMLVGVVACGSGASIVPAGFPSAPNVISRRIDESDALCPVEAIWRESDAHPLRHRMFSIVRDELGAGRTRSR